MNSSHQDLATFQDLKYTCYDSPNVILITSSVYSIDKLKQIVSQELEKNTAILKMEIVKNIIILTWASNIIADTWEAAKNSQANVPSVEDFVKKIFRGIIYCEPKKNEHEHQPQLTTNEIPVPVPNLAVNDDVYMTPVDFHESDVKETRVSPPEIEEKKEQDLRRKRKNEEEQITDMLQSPKQRPRQTPIQRSKPEYTVSSRKLINSKSIFSYPLDELYDLLARYNFLFDDFSRSPCFNAGKKAAMLAELEIKGFNKQNIITSISILFSKIELTIKEIKDKKIDKKTFMHKWEGYEKNLENEHGKLDNCSFHDIYANSSRELVEFYLHRFTYNDETGKRCLTMYFFDQVTSTNLKKILGEAFNQPITQERVNQLMNAILKVNEQTITNTNGLSKTNLFAMDQNDQRYENSIQTTTKYSRNMQI